VQSVWSIYNKLIERFGDEYSVLIDSPFEEMTKIVDARVAEAVVRARNEQIHVTPGYDGVYGQPVLFENEQQTQKQEKPIAKKQRNLTDFM